MHPRAPFPYFINRTYPFIISQLGITFPPHLGLSRADVAPELAAMMGGGTTGAAVDHRLRPIKQLAKLQLVVRGQKKDPGDLPIDGSGDLTLHYLHLISSLLPLRKT